MTNSPKFNPQNIKSDFKDFDFDNLPKYDFEYFNLDSQKEKSSKFDWKTAQQKQKIHHKDQDQKMKQTWSLILGIYLFIFTCFMFTTLWINIFLKLESSTLNSLIIAGFVKVIGVVWAIVSHLFPKPIKIDKIWNC